MSKSTTQKVYQFEDFRFDVDHLMLYRCSQPVPIAPKAAETLLALIQRRGEILSKDELLQAVWPDTVVEESNLFLYLSVLRKTLGTQTDGKPWVETLRRRGYRFNGDVSLAENKASAALVEDGDTTLLRPIQGAKHLDSSQIRYVLVISLGVILVATGFVATSFYWRNGKASLATSGVLRTMAILPFKPLITEDRDEALELGMADEIISRLGNNRSIQVVPLSEVRKFNKPDQNAVEAGKILGVTSVLEASIRRYGDRIRAHVRLISVADGDLIWADTFDEFSSDLPKVMALRMADDLDFPLTIDEVNRLEKRYTSSTEASDYYRKGQYNVFKISEEGMRQGILFYEKAVLTDPNFALAYAQMADAYRRLASAGYARPEDVCRKAKLFATKALELDESLAEAHTALAWVLFMYEWDWEAAETELKRALELSPNNPDVHYAYAHFLTDAGRHDEAVAAIRRAIDLRPTTLITRAVESMILNAAGREDDAVVSAKTVLDFDQNFWPAHLQLGLAYYRQKRFSDAVTELQKANELAPTAYQARSSLGLVYAVAGNKKGAYEILHELENPKGGYIPFHKIAMIYNALGQKEKALNLLERALKERETHLMDIRIERSLGNLRSEPRFIELLKKMNLEK